MKFGRLLKTTSLDLPEMEALFSVYKSLKKQVKRLPFKDQLGQQGTLETLSEAEASFVKALSDTLNQLNEMFLEKEENSVIRVERLEHELAAATAPEQLNALHKDFVDFHGEVLLLVHWSILAYTATVKILKKHHKRTGLLVKAPQLGNLLSQPFCSTELMTSIAHRVEEDIQRLAERMGVSGQRASEPTQQPLAQRQQQQQYDGAFADKAAAAAAVAAAAAAAAASAAETPLQLRDGGLDLQLLQHLADSGSVTSQSDTDGTKDEEDTAAHSGSTTRGSPAPQPLQQQRGGPSQQQQLLQECSQQAHMHDRGTVSEVVQAEPKRRRLDWQSSVSSPSDVAMAGAAAAAVAARDAAAAAAGAAGSSAAAAAVAPGDQGTEQQQQEEAGVAADVSDQRTLATTPMPPPPEQQQQQQVFAEPLPPIARLLPQRCSSTGCAAGSEQQHPLPHAAAEAATPAAAPCSVCARHGSIMRQTQVALTTWQHLQSTASTPSTVIPGPHPHQGASASALTESSAA